jgi:hypothetical protein
MPSLMIRRRSSIRAWYALRLDMRFARHRDRSSGSASMLS